MDSKHILKSKTFWVNIIALLIGALELFNPEFFHGVGVTPEKQQMALGIIGSVTAVLNLVIRVLTSQPVDAGMVGNIITGIVSLIPKKKK